MNLAELGKGERRALDDARRNDALGWVFGPSRTVRKRDLLKLIERGLVRECSTTAVVVDGDGFIKHPVRFVRAYELTELGKEVARAAELEDEQRWAAYRALDAKEGE